MLDMFKMIIYCSISFIIAWVIVFLAALVMQFKDMGEIYLKDALIFSLRYALITAFFKGLEYLVLLYVMKEKLYG
jgi:hypothetical protein